MHLTGHRALTQINGAPIALRLVKGVAVIDLDQFLALAEVA